MEINLYEITQEQLRDELFDLASEHIGVYMDGLNYNQRCAARKIQEKWLASPNNALGYQATLETLDYARRGRKAQPDRERSLYALNGAEEYYYLGSPEDLAWALSTERDADRYADCVFRAARARLLVENGDDVPLGWLAALAGVSIETLHLDPTLPDKVTAEDAREVLTEEGVEVSSA